MSNPQIQRDPWAKDCGCITHTGPHWLHMYAFDLRRLREAKAHFIAEHEKAKALPEKVPFATAVQVDAALGMAVGAMSQIGVETYREARLAMQGAGVDSIPAELLERALREWDEPPEEARRAWAKERLREETKEAPAAPVEAVAAEAAAAAKAVDAADSAAERARAAEQLRQAEADLAKAKGARQARAKFGREQLGFFTVERSSDT